ncbi:MAG TPA: IPT/TIG domain-containing protein [Pyrinomonadaceae bacterium]
MAEVSSLSERNKIIAAIVLGVLALGALWFAFGPSLGGSSTNVSVSVSPTPRRSSSSRNELGPVTMPSKAEQDLGYMVPVVYNPAAYGTAAPGRNIFAFYEPPPPCPGCPTPVPIMTPVPTPTPTPPLPFEIRGVSPQSVYAGSKTFRIDVAGERFTPDARIYFNNRELQTTFINDQRLAANVPAELIANQGQGGVMVRTPDGKGYSLSTFLSVQPPPKPNFQYVGMIARRHGNNDTAYLQESGRQTPTGYRLNDVVSGRFKLVDISSEKVTVEDTSLGFRHSVDLYRPAPGTAVTTRPGGFPTGPGGVPGFQTNPRLPTQGIPGIPGNIPRYVPPNRNANSNTQRPDEDDDDDGDTDNP